MLEDGLKYSMGVKLDVKESKFKSKLVTISGEDERRNRSLPGPGSYLNNSTLSVTG